MLTIENKFVGCLVGGAIGDAMGVPHEGSNGPLEYSPPDTWRISDDTQLTLATCEGIVKKGKVSPEAIAEEMCNWFREGRISGIGASTLKALRELEAGGHWALVGRKGEMAAGNGAAMRIAPLGLVLNPNNHSDRVLIRDICRITHHSDEAYIGALAVVVAVHSVVYKKQSLRRSLFKTVSSLLPDSNVKDRIVEIREFAKDHSIQECGNQFGTSGYVAESVPLAIAAATYVPELGFQAVLEEVISCGGDTDTIASMVGQIAGASLGINNIPTELSSQIEDMEMIRGLVSQLLKFKEQPYTRDELGAISDDDWPTRGVFCPKCTGWIPAFAQLSKKDEAYLRSLPTMKAMKTIKDKVNCPLRWAKIWALHPDGPESLGPPCPYCNEPLQTALAQQCLSCGADWHKQDPSSNHQNTE